MITLRRFPIKALTAVAATALIAGCSSSSDSNENEVVMGNATAAPASQPVAQPAGTVTKSDLKVTDAAFVNDTVAFRAGDNLLVGSAKDMATGKGLRLSIDDQCADLSAGTDSFLLACPREVQVISTDGQVVRTLGTGEKGEAYSAATMLADGNVLAAVANSNLRKIFSPSNDVRDTFKVSSQADQLVRVPLSGGGERVLEANRSDTSIHGMVIEESKPGAALRAGIGMGQLAAAGPGTAIASDTAGSQLLVYTTDDILRLNMSRAVPKSPWAVWWDDHRNLAWVGSTEKSELTAWDISTGVPIQAASLNLLADGQAIVPDGQGGIICASATGAGIQHITADELDKALEQGKPALDKERSKDVPRSGTS